MPVHPIKELLTEYDKAYEYKYHARAPISWAKDSKLAQTLLARYSLEELVGWLPAYFEHPDKFVQQGGHTFGVFVSCLGKVIAFAQSRKQLQATREKATAILDGDREHLAEIRRLMAEKSRQNAIDNGERYYREHPEFRPSKPS